MTTFLLLGIGVNLTFLNWMVASLLDHLGVRLGGPK